MAVQEATQIRTERTHLEEQTRALQAKCSELEDEKYEAIVEENKKLKTKLAQYEPPQEEKRAE